jgi:hypothetical protein
MALSELIKPGDPMDKKYCSFIAAMLVPVFAILLWADRVRLYSDIMRLLGVWP